MKKFKTIPNMYKNISVIGCGRWGSFLSYYTAKYCTENVLLYGRENSETYKNLEKNRRNEYLALLDNISLTSKIEEILLNNLIFISIGCQNLRTLAKELNNYNLDGKIFILAMKGLEINTCKRLSEIIFEEIKQNIKVCVLLGPGHVQDYINNVPSCAVVDSEDENLKKEIANFLNSNLMRVYYGNDIIGNEIGAALKNVIGIVAGILDGLNWYGLKGALMTRAPLEVGRIIEKFGGNKESAYGLAHLGDYEATLFSQNSHNRQFGENLVKGIGFDKLAEGYYTLEAIYKFILEKNIYAPICKNLYKFIYEKAEFNEIFDELFNRESKREFDL